MARRGPLKTMKVASSSPTRTIPFTPTTLQSRDRKGAPMARRGPLKTMKVASSCPTRTIPFTPTTLQSRDRKEADLPQPQILTLTGAQT